MSDKDTKKERNKENFLSAKKSKPSSRIIPSRYMSASKKKPSSDESSNRSIKLSDGSFDPCSRATSTPTSSFVEPPASEISSIKPRRQLWTNLSALGSVPQTIKLKKPNHPSLPQPRKPVLALPLGELGQFFPAGNVKYVYMRYLQSMTLKTRTINAYKERKEDVMRKIWALWNTYSTNFKKNQLMLQKNETAKHFKEVSVHTEELLKLLRPIVDNLKQFDTATLSRAIDSTRHQLVLHGISTPHDPEELVHVFKELNEAIRTIVEQLQSQEDTKELSEALSELVELQARCCNDLEEAILKMKIIRSSAIEDVSSKIGEIQAENRNISMFNMDEPFKLATDFM